MYHIAFKISGWYSHDTLYVVYHSVCRGVLAICSPQVPAGRRINFEGLAFGNKAILRQNTSDHVISQPCLPFPLNDCKIFEKGRIIPLRRGQKRGAHWLNGIGWLLPPARRATAAERGDNASHSERKPRGKPSRWEMVTHCHPGKLILSG